MYPDLAINDSSSSDNDENPGIAMQISKRNGNTNKKDKNSNDNNVENPPNENRPGDLPPKNEDLINEDKWPRK